MAKGFGKGKSPRKFSFTYEDFAKIVGCSKEAVRKCAQRGQFDPTDLVSVLEFIKERLEPEIERASVPARHGYARGDVGF